jgi:hypothetical protein
MVRRTTGLLSRFIRLIGRRMRSADRPTIQIRPFLGQIMALGRSLTGTGDRGSMAVMAVNRRRARGTRIKLIEHVRTLDRKSL